MSARIRKTILLLLAALFLTLPAHAEPILVVDATLTVQHPDGTKDIMPAQPLTLASGTKGIMQVGARDWTVTPTLKNGVVVVPMVLTRREGDKAVVETRPQVAMKLGQVAELEVGDLRFTITVTLAK